MLSDCYLLLFHPSIYMHKIGDGRAAACLTGRLPGLRLPLISPELELQINYDLHMQLSAECVSIKSPLKVWHTYTTDTL